MNTVENYFYSKGALDYRDQLIEKLYEMRSTPEVDYALRFVRETYPREVESRVAT